MSSCPGSWRGSSTARARKGRSKGNEALELSGDPRFQPLHRCDAHLRGRESEAFQAGSEFALKDLQVDWASAAYSDGGSPAGLPDLVLKDVAPLAERGPEQVGMHSQLAVDEGV